MKRMLNNKCFLYFLGIIFLFGLWMIISLATGNNETIFPNPYVVVKEMIHLLGQKTTYKYLGFSIIRLLIGFAISFSIAFVLGLIVNDNEKTYNFVRPAITFIKAAPTATFVFLFIVLSGAKNAPIYVVIAITFPVLYESIVGSFKSTDKAMIAQARVDGAGKLKRLFLIQLPCGLPFIEVGILSSFALAFKIEIMAEIITGYTNGGLGSIMNTSQLLDPSNLVPIFAYSLLAIIVVIIFEIVSDILRAKYTPKTLNRRAMEVK